MMRRYGARWLARVGLVAAALLFWSNPAGAQAPCADGRCAPAHGPGPVMYSNDCFHCQKHHCPPHLKHCMERPPHIHYACGCPKPVCNPCYAPNWGYFQTCWTPWPWPPDWSHCPVQPPASAVFPGLVTPGAPTTFDLPRKRNGI